MTEKRKFRWSKAVLVVSLGLNLVVAGLVAGAWWNGPDRGAHGQSRSVWANSPFGRALSEEDRKALSKELRAEKGAGKTLRGQRKAMRDNAKAITAALRADPFDPAVLGALFEDMVDLGRRQHNIGSQALLDRLVSMSKAQRLGFADRFEEAAKRPRRKRN
jgi:uncharacterized membrane protein